MKNFFSPLILILLCLPAVAQQKVVPVASPSEVSLFSSNEGFYYLLPKSVFAVTVKVAKTREYQGYYGEYADKLLGLKHIITHNKISYQLGEVSIRPFTVPDSACFYAVELSSAQRRTGFLDHLLKGYAPPEGLPQDSDYCVQTAPIPDFFRHYADLAYTEKDDSFVETKIIEGVVTQVPVNQTKLISRSTAQKAQEAADFIMKIRKERYDLLAGVNEVPYPGDAIRYMMEQFDQLEQNYLQLFTGFTVTDEETYTFFYIPNGEPLSPLFSLDPEKGFSRTPGNSKGNNYYMEIEPMIDHGTYHFFESSKYAATKLKAHEGYRVRKALPAVLRLKKESQPIHLFGIYYIHQLGRIETLPAKSDHFNILEYGFLY